MSHSSEQGGDKHIAEGLEIKTLWGNDREIKREAPEVLTPQAHVIGDRSIGNYCSYSPGCYGGHEHGWQGRVKGLSKKK